MQGLISHIKLLPIKHTPQASCLHWQKIKYFPEPKRRQRKLREDRDQRIPSPHVDQSHQIGQQLQAPGETTCGSCQATALVRQTTSDSRRRAAENPWPEMPDGRSRAAETLEMVRWRPACSRDARCQTVTLNVL